MRFRVWFRVWGLGLRRRWKVTIGLFKGFGFRVSKV